jgi:hypothetical protein
MNTNYESDFEWCGYLVIVHMLTLLICGQESRVDYASDKEILVQYLESTNQTTAVA